jgi:glycosyltransferase involved in cell wall biosynthesis
LKAVVITHNYIRRRGDLTALYLHRLSSGLVRKGIELIVICPHAPGLLKEDNIDGVRIIRFPYLFSGIKQIVYTGSMHEIVAASLFAKVIFFFFLCSFYRAAVRVCRREKPDIIWANWWIPPGLVAARVASKFRIPLVISSHGTDIALLEKGKILKSLSLYVYKRTNMATVVSTFLKQRLLKRVRVIAKDNVAVIPMPVGMEHFPRTDLPDHEVPVLLSVARYTKQKRLSDIIAAAQKVAVDKIPFKILMVGEGPLETELKELAEKAGLSDRIEFIPLVAQQKLGGLYRRSDAVVLVSEEEGFGLVLVEAGLTGRPVIGSRSGGITDIVDEGENGLLVEPGDVEGLARSIRTLFENREMRQRLGDGGHKKAVEKFATPVLVNKVYNLFVSLSEGSKITDAA